MQYPRILPLVLCLVPAAFSAQTSVTYSPVISPGAQGPANTYAVDLNNDLLILFKTQILPAPLPAWRYGSTAQSSTPKRRA